MINEKNKTLGIVLGLLYYVLICIFFFLFYIFGIFGGIIIDFSETLFIICYIYFAIFLLILPLFFKFILKKKFYKAIIYSTISFVIYLFVLFFIRIAIITYMSNFTKEKWNNSNHWNLRYLMVDNFEMKYNIIGMNKEEVYELLGTVTPAETSYGENNKICYLIRGGLFAGTYYCFEYDENGVIVNTHRYHWN